MSSRPPDSSAVVRCERDGSRKMMVMMITGEERQEGSGVGHVSPPVGRQLINLSLTLGGGVGQSEGSRRERKSPFDFGGGTSREADELGSNCDLSPNVTAAPPPGARCHHLGGFKEKCGGDGWRKSTCEFLIRLFSVSQVELQCPEWKMLACFLFSSLILVIIRQLIAVNDFPTEAWCGQSSRVY